MPKKHRPKKKKIIYDDSHLEEKFIEAWIKRYPYALPIREYKFHSHRQFRLDFAWPSKKVGVEIQGYGPGHFSLIGATSDYNRHIECLRYGWKMLYFTTLHLNSKKIHLTLNIVAEFLQLPVPSEIETHNLIHPDKYIPYSKRK